MKQRARIWQHITDSLGTVTLDGSADCLPLSTDFTCKAYDIGGYYTDAMMLYFKCSDVTTPIVTKYQVSVDGLNWIDGQNAVADLDNNEQWILLHANEQGAHYIRINVNNTNAAAATATVIIASKS